MKKTKFTDSQILKALKENQGGRSAADISRELGISQNTFYTWRKKYAGMDSAAMRRLKELEEENRKLKQMYADLALSNTMLKDVIEKKL